MNRFPHYPADAGLSPSLPRIIITGKNSSLPKVVSIPLGYAVDGAACLYRVTLKPNESVCAECKGSGEISTWDGNPGHRSETERCECCDGEGIISPEAVECEA